MRELFALAGYDTDDDLAWQERSLCSQVDPELFFPEKGTSVHDAKRVCLSCEVRAECLDYAMENDERFGVWGGLSENERRALRRKRRGVSTRHKATPVTKMPEQRPQTAQEDTRVQSA